MTTQTDVYMWNSQIECLARPELEELQLSRLQAIIRYAYERVALFKQRMDEAGVKPDSIRTLKDLKNVPFMRKADLRESYPVGLFAQPLENVTRLHASSGTRGKPTIVGYTKNDISTWAESISRSLACAGARPGDIIHNAYGYGLFTGGLGLHYGAENFGATVVPASGGRTQQQIMLLQDLQARILCCTPSYALNISYTIDELKVDRNSMALEIGIFGAEPWTEEMRGQIEERLRIKALDIYGLSEVMGPGVSMECIHGRNGLHVWEDHYLPEIIDPLTGDVLPPGVEGELVFTTLTKEAIPVIRYRTGDLSTLFVDKCKCGRTMQRMARVRARIDDMLIIRGVNVYPSEVEKALLQIKELAPNYQLILERVKALDSLEIQVEISEHVLATWESFEAAESQKNAINKAIKSVLKDSLGLSAQVTLMRPNSLPRSEGKAVRVVDKRQR